MPGEVACQLLDGMDVTVFEPVPQLYEETQVRAYRAGRLRPAVCRVVCWLAFLQRCAVVLGVAKTGVGADVGARVDQHFGDLGGAVACGLPGAGSREAGDRG